ncbi:MAG: terminase small subunit [Bdellovibrionota bacterium]
MRIRQMGFSSRLIAHRHLLTLETLKFIVEYLQDDNVKGAAIRAGIPETYASRQGQWLKKLPMVKKALETDIHERDLKKLQASIAKIEAEMRACKTILGLEDF